MEFAEAKTRIEFGLKLLGHTRAWYLVHLNIWQLGKVYNSYIECPDKKHEDLPKSCLGCHKVYIPSSMLEDLSEDDIIKSIQGISGWILRSEQLQRARAKV